jgi:hypothetical protein
MGRDLTSEAPLGVKTVWFPGGQLGTWVGQ